MQVLLARKVSKAFRAWLGQLARRVIRAHRVMLGQQDLRVIRAQLAYKARQGQQGRKVCKAM